ncbi:unnamed protein product [Leptidea sinapis]|uniref:Uncharacterized protein n=1 Tax=Leptidea sinapis TaxID=189913 RepID=A0A5E4Q5Z0_9NEOP|nr:unnamed protein product [Leptidea sinapis]
MKYQGFGVPQVPGNICSRYKATSMYNTQSRHSNKTTWPKSSLSASNNPLNIKPKNIMHVKYRVRKNSRTDHDVSTPESTYRIENRSTSSRQVIKDVFIPVNNTEEEIIKFLKEHTVADRTASSCYRIFISRAFMLYAGALVLYASADVVIDSIDNTNGIVLIKEGQTLFVRVLHHGEKVMSTE